MRVARSIAIASLAASLVAGVAAGVVAQEEPAAGATEITGRAIFGPWLRDPGVTETPDGIKAGDGFVFLHGWDTTDPRMNGEMTRTVNFRFDAFDFTNGIESVSYEMTNEGGTWVGDGRAYSFGDDGSGFVALRGQGGYDGLTAFIVHEGGDGTFWELKGVIFPSAIPEIPEPYVAE